MLICDDCGSVFDDEDCNTEYEEFGKAFSVCQHCKSDELSHAFQCTVCDTYQELGQTSKTDDVCQMCFDETVMELRSFAQTTFTGEKLIFATELLNEMGNENGYY